MEIDWIDLNKDRDRGKNGSVLTRNDLAVTIFMQIIR